MNNNADYMSPDALYRSGLSYLKRKEKHIDGLVGYTSMKDAFPSEDEYAEGMACLERAALQGCIKAQTALGEFYTSGVQVSLNGTSAHILKRDNEKG